MRIPKWPGGHDLDETTQLYLDTYIAIDLLHMRYPDYIATVPQLERLQYQFFVMMKSAKEDHAQKRSQQQAEDERQSREMMDRGGQF